MKSFLIKLILTIVLIMVALNPYFESGNLPGGLSEFQVLGVIPSIIVAVAFLTAIAFYCISLQRTLNLIRPKNRTRTPKSVWYMYLMPFNFIEDFFIVIDIANSLRNELKFNKKLASYGDFGLTLGIGWSVAQLFSFIPHLAGQVASIVGLILWLMHWRLIWRINQDLHLA